MITLDLLDADGIGIGDDLLFSTSFQVTAEEALAGAVDRIIDATFDPLPFLPDGFGGDKLNVYARAFVDKDACSTFCTADRPETARVDVRFIRPASVSEPATFVLLGVGLVLLGLRRLVPAVPA